jgi:tetratricopeptide (TPR) repeat protein
VKAARRKGESPRTNHWRASGACLAIIPLFLVATVALAQMTAISGDQHLAGPPGDSKTEKQWLAQVDSERRLLNSHPDSARDQLLLGQALQALDETEGAARAFDRALELDPKLAEAMVEKGLMLADQTEWSRAANLFRRAAAASPGYSLAHLALGDMLLRTGEFDGCVQELKTVLRLDAASSGAYQGLGLVHLQQGDFDQAVDDFRRALAIKPGFLDAEKGLGHALAAAHKWPEAAAWLRRVLAANPNSTQEIATLGNVLARLGDQAGAQAEFARARELSDQEALLLRAKGENNWGVALRKEGKLADAAAAFRRALDEDSSFCEAHDNLGSLLWLLKDSASAMTEFQSAVRCDPNLASARNNFGTALLYHNHDMEKASEQFRAAVSLRPGFALAHLNLGKVLAAQQDWAQAEPEFRHAILLDPDLAAAHVGLGLVLATKQSSMSAEARAEMEKGLRLDPNLRALIPESYLGQLP